VDLPALGQRPKRADSYTKTEKHGGLKKNLRDIFGDGKGKFQVGYNEPMMGWPNETSMAVAGRFEERVSVEERDLAGGVDGTADRKHTSKIS